MRRILAFALAALMICAAAALTAHAADRRMTIKVESVNAAPDAGTVVKVPVYITENTGYISALFNVEWDSDALELTEVEYTELGPDQSSAPIVNSGKYTMRLGDSLRLDSFKDTGVFFTLVFKVTENAAEGSYKVAVTDPDILDADEVNIYDMAVTTIAGYVNLTGAAAGGEGDMPTQGSDSGSGSETSAGTVTESGDDNDQTEGSGDKPTEGGTITATEIAPTGDSGNSGTTGTDQKGSDSTVLWIILFVAGIAVLTAVVVIVVRSKGKKDDKKEENVSKK